MQNSNLGGSGGRGGQLLLPGEGQNYNLIGAKSYKTDIISPTRPAPLKPTPPKLPSDVHLPTRAAPKIPSTSARLSENYSDYAVNIPPELPPANKPLNRPLISAPVLSDTTSQTVRELIDNPGAIRHSYIGPVTSGSIVATNPFIANDIAMRGSNLEPINSKSSTLPPVHIESKAAPRSTNPGASTLNRITSFMSRHSTRRKSNKNLTAPLQGSQDSVRSLEISQPILQNGDVSIPLSKLSDKAEMIKRTQSMRETDANFKRPNLPAFGSMRAKRPASLAGSQRPSQPPPPAPSGITSMPGYQNPMSPTSNVPRSTVDTSISTTTVANTSSLSNNATSSGLAKPKTYDDCLNLLSDSLAALVNVSSNPSDNIYAVIEESPPPSRSPPESLGLLGEIVSEIQARNTESIYSSNNLMDSNKLYMNTRDLNNPSPDPTIKSTTSSGYLSPINGINNRDNQSSQVDSSSNLNRPSGDSSTNSYRINSSSSTNVPSSKVNNSHNVPSSIAPTPSHSYVNTSVSSKPSTSVNSISSLSAKPLVSSLHSSKTNPVSSISSGNNGRPITSSAPARPTTLAGLKSTSTAKPSGGKHSVSKSTASTNPGALSIKSPPTNPKAPPINAVTKPVSETSGAKKQSPATIGYKPFTSRGPMSGNTVSSYTKPVEKSDKPSVTGKASLPMTSGVSSMLSKPVVPQRPAPSVLKRPDLISNLSSGSGNVATSPDVVNKGKSNVASLQQKFQSH